MISRMLKISPAPQAVTREVQDGRERRAVALATEAWLARLSLPEWRGDAIARLRQI